MKRLPRKPGVCDMLNRDRGAQPSASGFRSHARLLRIEDKRRHRAHETVTKEATVLVHYAST